MHPSLDLEGVVEETQPMVTKATPTPSVAMGFQPGGSTVWTLRTTIRTPQHRTEGICSALRIKSHWWTPLSSAATRGAARTGFTLQKSLHWMNNSFGFPL